MEDLKLEYTVHELVIGKKTYRFQVTGEGVDVYRACNSHRFRILSRKTIAILVKDSSNELTWKNSDGFPTFYPKNTFTSLVEAYNTIKNGTFPHEKDKVVAKTGQIYTFDSIKA